MLERGGDDVVRKPFAYPELRARIAAVLRRSELRRRTRILRAGPIVIDVRSREVRVVDRPVELSAKEYDLLVTLAGEPTRVFTRAELMRGVWGQQTFGHTPHARQPRVAASAQAVRRRRRQAGDQRLGRRLPTRSTANCIGCKPRCGPMSDRRPHTAERRRALPAARRRAGRDGAGGDRARADGRGAVRARAPRRSRTRPARCCTPPTRSSRCAGPLPGLFAEQAGALLAVAARFEEAADLTRARQSTTTEGRNR